MLLKILTSLMAFTRIKGKTWISMKNSFYPRNSGSQQKPHRSKWVQLMPVLWLQLDVMMIRRWQIKSPKEISTVALIIARLKTFSIDVADGAAAFPSIGWSMESSNRKSSMRRSRSSSNSRRKGEERTRRKRETAKMPMLSRIT